MTLVELLIALAIMLTVVVTLGTLAKGVQQSFEYCDAHGVATQHARIVLDRITQTVAEATANDQFPGCLVVAERSGTWRFPETLVVWHPDGQPADPDGLPRWDELVIYTPNTDAPNQLLEVTLPGNTLTVPAASDTTAWLKQITAIRKSDSASKVLLTDLLHTGADGNLSDHLRGAVRFETRLRPSEANWLAYKAGTTAWKDLPWVQGVYGSQTGLRQTWVRFELQFVPLASAATSEESALHTIPFFGSSAIYYQLHR